MYSVQKRMFHLMRSSFPARRATTQPSKNVYGIAITFRFYMSNTRTETDDNGEAKGGDAGYIRSAETIHLMRTLKLTEPDDFQNTIIMWIKGYVRGPGGTIIPYPEDRAIDVDVVGSAFGKTAVAIGGTKTGKTTSYLLALSDLVNLERHDADGLGAQRDEYRNKIILNKSLRSCKPPSRPNMPKVHGLPKFDWNCLMTPLAIVLVPHREMGMEIFALSSKMELRTRLFAGGMGYKKQSSFAGGYASVANKKQHDNVDVIVSTPEMILRVIHGAFDDARIDIKFLRFLIMEEADLLCDGFYLEQVNELLNMIDSQQLRTLGITATKTDALMNHIQQAHLDGKAEMLKRVTIVHPQSHTIGSSVRQVFTAIAQSDPVDRLLETLEELNARAGSGGAKTVVFCNTVKCCKFVEHVLKDRGYNTESLHGEMGYEQRSKSVKGFGTRSNILVATNVASRGALSKQVDHVVSFDFPRNVADYLHRTARVAKNGTVYTFFSKKHLPVLKSIQRINTPEHRIEYRNVSARVARVLQLQVEWDAKLALRNRKLKKGGRKALNLPPRRNILSPANKKIMKRFYLREKAIKKVKFLQKRGLLRKGYGLPRWPDRAVEASESQEFVRMQRSADGFLQIIPKRRSRIRHTGEVGNLFCDRGGDSRAGERIRHRRSADRKRSYL
ncbi:DEAD-box ATP-dependent RNA helicase 39 [Babesia sp. Xinjiang]|uniref:DEAD-box ATP-dependent RNA helicase 39 n=1 Tax=Babesia sp. Xinjiang TaxID=462227 RepID=UPI000A218916|nr:DEAD-box ATP-dependent RNA helicase 39 [Babesia sp. Xinjiang]ORM39584.1 DEAD-box ATP-dependent RNA helicase 39 [Babesia sp. Xinjiang]